MEVSVLVVSFVPRFNVLRGALPKKKATVQYTRGGGRRRCREYHSGPATHGVGARFESLPTSMTCNPRRCIVPSSSAASSIDVACSGASYPQLLTVFEYLGAQSLYTLSFSTVSALALSPRPTAPTIPEASDETTWARSFGGSASRCMYIYRRLCSVRRAHHF